MTPVGSGYVAAASDRVDLYAKLYFGGSYDDLASAVRNDLIKAVYADPQPDPRPDLLNSYVSVVFVATPPAQKDLTVVRFLVPPKGSAATEPPQRLPGVAELYEALLSRDKQSRIASSWISTAKENPLRAQLIKGAQTIVNPLAGLVDAFSLHMKIQAVTAAERATISQPLFVVVNRVRLPHARAGLQITTRVTNPAVGDAEELKAEFARLAAQTARGVSRVSPCARVVSTALNAQAAATLAAPVTAETRKRLIQALEGEADRVLATTDCTDEAKDTTDGALAHARAEAVAEVVKQNLQLASGDLKPIAGTSDLQNVPHQHLSLGLVAGAMINKSGDVGFQVSNGKLAPKPLSGAVTSAVLHIHPFAYDPASPQATAAERFSFFTGFVVTPAPGATAGISLRFFRGLGVQAGYAAMVVNRLKPEFTPGQEVTVVADPFRRGVARSWVLGISYDFN